MTDYTFRFSKRAQKFIKKQPKNIQGQLETAIYHLYCGCWKSGTDL